MADTAKIPPPPPGTRAGGRRVWDDVLGKWECDAHERAVLASVVRTIDLIDALDATIRADGHMDSSGRVHPAVVEVRQQRLVLARLTASLRLPEDDAGTVRPQRRGAVRGVYALPGSA